MIPVTSPAEVAQLRADRQRLIVTNDWWRREYAKLQRRLDKTEAELAAMRVQAETAADEMADLDVLLDEDSDRTCELLAQAPPPLEQCERLAEWVVTYRCTRPEHERVERLLTCSKHMTGAAQMKCGGCRLNGVRAELLVIYAELLR